MGVIRAIYFGTHGSVMTVAMWASHVLKFMSWTKLGFGCVVRARCRPKFNQEVLTWNLASAMRAKREDEELHHVWWIRG